MPNALVHEKSPYLLQHAGNPVNWLPWSEAAFDQARKEQKPIFLSIGYATCHWCHVMAHESFEDPAIAELLNASFVAIKVDREERPDVDKVYMAYVQAMTGHGGWPLSAWLTPELKPFFGGTYFPPSDRSGRPGFPSILNAIANGWAQEREKLVSEGDRVIATLREMAAEKSVSLGSEVGESTLGESGAAAFEKCFQHLYESFDPNHGGFGGAPKFPRASNLDFLFRAAALQGVRSEAGVEALHLATATLQAMARGGIHDHVGGGYHRYAVDGSWFVPHFEKMLYDQAQIAINALEAKQATGDERYAWMARDIFAYVARDLTHPEGGFYSAEDADSAIAANEGEHAEGAFYVWTYSEIADVLGADATLFGAHFSVTRDGNVPSQLDPQEEFPGKNILIQRQSLRATASALSLSLDQANDRILIALEKLRQVRQQRPRPLLDGKIIAAWNGYMISALARGHQVLGATGPETQEISFLTRATRAAEFLYRELHDEKRGRLFRSWREGRSAVEGFAEDYAAVIQGMLDLYEAGFEIRWLRWAQRLQQTMDELFWDEAAGGYFNSRSGDPHIVVRLKDDYDGAEPAASSTAAMNLLRLGAIFDHGVSEPGANGYRERGRRTLAAFRTQWSEAPHALPRMLCALELALDEPRHLVMVGDPVTPEFSALVAIAHENLGPRRALLAADGGDGQQWLAASAPWLGEMKPIDGRATAYLCENFTCRAPMTSPEELRAALR